MSGGNVLATSQPGRAPHRVGSQGSVRLRAALVLSLITVALLIAASAAGLLFDGLYRGPAATSSMLRAYDLVTLVVIVPALIIGLGGVWRGSIRGLLVWLSMLAATVYTYAYYLFEAAFNDLFLLHVAVFACALYALIFGMSAIDTTEIADRFSARTPRRWIGGFLALLALTLGGIWILASVRFALTGQIPVGSVLVETDSLVHLGIALDLALLVPSYAMAAVFLWRRIAWGYVLAAILLISGVVHQISYLIALPFQVAAEVPGATALDPVEPVIAAGFLIATIALLVSARSPKTDPDKSGT